MNWQHAGYITSENSGRQYEIKINEKGEYGCSCPAYKFSGQRSCKHTEKFKAQMGIRNRRIGRAKLVVR